MRIPSPVLQLVVDASVVVAAVSPSEPGYSASLNFLTDAHRRRVVLVEPPQFLLELYAVFTRAPRQLRDLGFVTEADPFHLEVRQFAIEDVQGALQWLTAIYPGRCPTRGADLAYLWVAHRAAVPLVTLDRGLQGFRTTEMPVLTPDEAHGLARAS